MKVYQDPSCSTQVGTDYTYANNATSDQAVTVSVDASYYFQVTVEDNAGNTTISACSSAVAAIATTANTVFQPSPGFTREGIPMTWDPRANATGYIVYRQKVGNGDITWAPTDGTTYTTASNVSVESGIADSKIVYAGNATSTKDTIELEDNKTYQYKIFAHNANHYYETGPAKTFKNLSL